MDGNVCLNASYIEDSAQLPEEHPRGFHSWPLFSGLAENTCSRILAAATRCTVERHESLVVEKEGIRDFILLESGNVKHTQISPNGNDVLLRICGPGEVIAGPGFSGLSRHRYSARAIEESTILSWRSEEFHNYMQMHPRLAINMNQILSARVKELETRIREFTSEEVTTRVALLLVRLSKHMGKAVEDGIRIAITQDEIAQMAGLSVFTVSRMLSRWSGRGLVSTRRQAVVLTDVRRLARRYETKITR